VNLTEADYRLFADAVEERRAQNETGESTGNVTKQILADEYATLAEDRNELQSLDPTLETQIEELWSLNDSEVEALVADVLSSESDRSARALAFMPDYYEPGSTETNATLLVVTHESAGGSFAPGDAPEEIEDAQATMTELAPDDDSMAVLVYGDGVVSTEITDSMIDSVLLVGPWRSRSSCSCSWSSTETCSTSCLASSGSRSCSCGRSVRWGGSTSRSASRSLSSSSC